MNKIKRRQLTGLLLIMFCLPAAAQVGELRRNLAVGFSGGATYNKISATPRIEQNGMLGFTGGFTARYISEKYFAMICGVQLELNYTQRGWEEFFEDSPNTYSRTMNYLEVPFLAHLAFGRERGVRFFLNLGPQVNLLLNEKENFSDPFEPDKNGTIAQYGKMADNKFDYGIAGGGGLELRTKAGNFLLEGRYYFGLSDFYSTKKKDVFSRAAHSTITAKITYLFDLSR